MRSVPWSLSLTAVRFGFAEEASFLGPIDMDMSSGDLLTIVGPNGAGKSTLLRLIAGLLIPTTGSIVAGGRTLQEQSPATRARTMAYLPQQLPVDLELTVRALVLLGRYPYRSLGLFESAEDHRVAEQVMEETGVAALADRPLSTLSGGEAQRAHLAAALAQQPSLLLLDEPTASLDLYHQLAVFDIVARFAGRPGQAAIVVTHDVNLAVRYGTKALVLSGGRSVAFGAPSRVLVPDVLAPVYRVALTLADVGEARAIVPTKRLDGGTL